MSVAHLVHASHVVLQVLPLATLQLAVAVARRNMAGRGEYHFSGDPERWRTANRRPPAVYGIPGTDIRDMGRLLTANPKFAECQTKRAFRMLFLRDPQTNETYVLVKEQVFEKMRSLVGGFARSAGWDDPELDVYERHRDQP